MSLYDDLGGAKALDAVVDSFYKKVLADERVNGFFDVTDMERQAKKQKAFLAFAFGGPNNYTGKKMSDGHAHLVERGLNDSHVDAIIEILGATLTEFEVPAEKIQEAAAVAESVRDQVLGRAQ
ncbi:MAG: group 1 truncated hemoglobin [Pseudomonadales bacterium]|jgi:hemoglobin|uniref:group I truncated hemoglobin n=1 Tax=unclassified Ketobacter TaxID=2639109 RepID=UPI000C623B7A|nr:MULTISPECIES: group 1 truncated hemoglobin [unclassified Ketobacter]MAA59869.1 group 1 truncated hemoglobin [Pseudomonadales bacterium]MEC8813700.1 group 1 truncated hemoglobin [Pseudomonadota bacterium]HAG94521.1 group 1 truncated hemoglobin [Gammaproteobacteria bacterium]MAQ23804.1 group 1 truncated hemoglobin [Pseudomonadales bacterium]MBI26211.1 group 1 truncated hemoglobin [Pseudomonadales bacterium]|tara:strand:+ start:169 stop:537 length:369 start_codon:yes stop_codon:yes gene_type:complete